MTLIGRGKAVPSFAIESVEGLRIKGAIAGKKLLHGRNALLVQVTINQGTTTPIHRHRHESYLYVVSGSVKATVGGEVFALGPGDAVIHPADIDHRMEALVDSVWIEVKSPAEEPWYQSVSAT
jgi:quercetin dioxygenase-like cupin family protein